LNYWKHNQSRSSKLWNWSGDNKTSDWPEFSFSFIVSIALILSTLKTYKIILICSENRAWKYEVIKTIHHAHLAAIFILSFLNNCVWITLSSSNSYLNLIMICYFIKTPIIIFLYIFYRFSVVNSNCLML
jgi:hypothetical protein